MSAAPADVAAALRARIRNDGPIPLADFMATVADAYYGRRQAFGRDGDFITAPEISQVFGELIGLWCAVTWERMGRPSTFRLVECGPGRGTLMADLLRAAAQVPGFVEAAQIHLVERSASLRTQQQQMLGQTKVTLPKVTWHDDMRDVPAGPLIVIANEFVDALPIQQFVRTSRGWNERYVSLDDEAFVFAGISADGPPMLKALSTAKPGEVFEYNAAAITWVSHLATRIARDGGAALVIDYGHTTSALGDTLQAVKQHQFHPVLEDVGTADLTAHVDFAALATAARATGASVWGSVAQGTWLAQLGLAVRVAQLTRGKPAAQAAAISAAARRLTAPDGMGLLFKIMAVAHPGLVRLDGFAQDGAS